MASIRETSNQQQVYSAVRSRSTVADRVSGIASGPNQTGSVKETSDSKVETKSWNPVDPKSSLIPRKTEYGNTIGDVKLSDGAKDYYDKLKAKYGNMDFIAVSKDMKGLVAQNAAAYGNSSKMVVLIDEEKLERMASDESFRKKYEGIIAVASMKMTDAKNSLASTGANVKNFGMSVDSNGKESFFATVEKAGDQQKKLIEKRAAEKKEKKAKEHKKAEAKARQERIEKAKEKRAEKSEKADQPDHDEIPEDAEKRIHDKVMEVYGKEYVTIEADSMDDLLTKVQNYSYDGAAGRVMTDAERSLGGHIDFRG
ncbi:MAG: hypothetical protein IK078_12225 [Lachnospiraceae bacterium]|nr:hypothetical protein [Lachnospiraceae bacterium]